MKPSAISVFLETIQFVLVLWALNSPTRQAASTRPFHFLLPRFSPQSSAAGQVQKPDRVSGNSADWRERRKRESHQMKVKLTKDEYPIQKGRRRQRIIGCYAPLFRGFSTLVREDRVTLKLYAICQFVAFNVFLRNGGLRIPQKHYLICN